jgi:hypothetical protein
MAIKKKKTKKASAPGKCPSLKSPVTSVSSAQQPSLPDPTGVGKSVGALLDRVKSYFIPGKTAEA